MGKRPEINIYPPALAAETTQSSENRKIFRNTIYLYLRMILIMGITLYTARIIIAALGVDNFGIYSIVGGLVVLFAFLSGSISGATQRYLCVAMGRGNDEETRQVFSSSLLVYVLLCLLIVVLGETVGLWLVATKLSFPPGRHAAAMIVYQATIITTVLSLLRTPYQAAIIAHERMGFFAWSSILEAALKLLILIPLFHLDGDKLVVYAWLVCAVNLLLGGLYIVYTTGHFPSCRVMPGRGRLREILIFTGWSSFSSLANIGSKQGMNFILNIFCGVAVNAAVGIMNQVSGAVYGFIQNFQTAINPPLTKHYAAGEMAEVRGILFSSSRMSFYLMVFLSMPLMFFIEPVLRLWLDEVPPFTGEFCVMCLLSLYFNTFGGPIWTIMQASGKIKRYQLIISCVTLLTLPAFWVILKLRLAPYVVVAPTLVANVAVVFIGLQMIKAHIGIRARTYVWGVIARSVATAAIIAILLWGETKLQIGSGLTPWLRLGMELAMGYLLAGATVAFVGLNSAERRQIGTLIKSKLTHQTRPSI